MLRIQDFHRRFRDSDQCLDYLFALHHSDVECSRCGRKNSYHRHPTKLCYTCNCGQHHIFPKCNTLFEGSPIPLKKWFYAVFLMCQAPNGVSAKEIERRLKVTYATAWRMRKNISTVIDINESPEQPIGSESLLLACIGYQTELAPEKSASKKKTALITQRLKVGSA